MIINWEVITNQILLVETRASMGYLRCPPPGVAGEPTARLCHLRVWPDFRGYGFNLHTEKGRASQFIGKVDAGSPAAAAGLREGDRIMEVNGEVVRGNDHQGVVARIKAVIGETRLLVVDQQAERDFAELGVAIRGDMAGVRYIRCPDTGPGMGEYRQTRVCERRHGGRTLHPLSRHTGPGMGEYRLTRVCEETWRAYATSAGTGPGMGEYRLTRVCVRRHGGRTLHPLSRHRARHG